ncbi:MAG: hypothetical protein AVDCRST_MAG45-935 [uncultured Solirubrobacterales bacterium]|uniref:Uncharacterized protein n=1 Tax=uncultured Solirubrobacterales bacterium TaxID=768556 RepID=A0A6J4SKE1_9ACTN|nr:MAG: hypothetical protein AVDCRST_MAG45-935 [uncultured Solirubrobacterales bacterium]
MGVQRDADGVEAQLRRPRPLAHLGQVGGGHPADLRALDVVERVPRAARALPPRLDLAEDEVAVALEDEIELAEAGPVVAREDPEAQPLEVLGREPFAGAAEVVAGIAAHGRRRYGRRPNGSGRAGHKWRAEV